MKEALKFVEGLIVSLVIGVTAISAVALLIHTFAGPVKPDFRADLTRPPASLCPDEAQHCWVGQ